MKLEQELKNLTIKELIDIENFLKMYIPKMCPHTNFELIRDMGDIHDPDYKYKKKCYECGKYIDFTKEETDDYNKEMIEKKNKEFKEECGDSSSTKHKFFYYEDKFVKQFVKKCTYCQIETYKIDNNDFNEMKSFDLQDYARLYKVVFKIIKNSTVYTIPNKYNEEYKIIEINK